jgi:cytochrome c-type biogenesis protein CcmE
MDPGKKRRLRLFTALAAAVVLAGALIYTSFTAASPARTPSQLLTSARPGQTYQLTGKVVPGSIQRRGQALDFRVGDRNGPGSVAVHYVGTIPDPFRAGREVIVTVRGHGSSFLGERDSLVTKCPSKFTAAPGPSR